MSLTVYTVNPVASTHGGQLHILAEIKLNIYVYCQIYTRDWKIFDVMKL
jgi:hypothetical protein